VCQVTLVADDRTMLWSTDIPTDAMDETGAEETAPACACTVRASSFPGCTPAVPLSSLTASLLPPPFLSLPRLWRALRYYTSSPHHPCLSPLLTALTPNCPERAANLRRELFISLSVVKQTSLILTLTLTPPPTHTCAVRCTRCHSRVGYIVVRPCASCGSKQGRVQHKCLTPPFPPRPQTCAVTCSYCHSGVGYHVVRPCAGCGGEYSSNNGHYWLLHGHALTAEVRTGRAGGEVMVWSGLPYNGVEEEEEAADEHGCGAEGEGEQREDGGEGAFSEAGGEDDVGGEQAAAGETVDHPATPSNLRPPPKSASAVAGPAPATDDTGGGTVAEAEAAHPTTSSDLRPSPATASAVAGSARAADNTVGGARAGAGLGGDPAADLAPKHWAPNSPNHLAPNPLAAVALPPIHSPLTPLAPNPLAANHSSPSSPSHLAPNSLAPNSLAPTPLAPNQLPAAAECCVCLGPMRQRTRVAAACGHEFCFGCISKEVDHRGCCPLDRLPLTRAQLVRMDRQSSPALQFLATPPHSPAARDRQSTALQFSTAPEARVHIPPPTPQPAPPTCVQTPTSHHCDSQSNDAGAHWFAWTGRA
jgi:hypothetical protein